MRIPPPVRVAAATALALLIALSAGSVARARVPVAVLTQHNDAARTGANLSETTLNTANVNAAQFGKLFARPVDGDIYAQPLYVPNLAIPGQGLHNVVFVATQHNSVYAFDADDPAASAPLWHVNLGPSVPTGDFGDGNYRDIAKEVGVTSTPAIDLATGTIYVVAANRDGSKWPYTYRHRLHALNLLTGAEKLGGPAIVQGAVPGSGAASQNGVVAFDSHQQIQRSSLLLSRGVVYFAFASYSDYDPYHGWIFGYSAATLQQTAIFNTTPDGGGPNDPQLGAGGIWQSGQGISADANGDLYAIVGNGTFSANAGGRDYGNSFLKLRPGPTGLTVVDWFTPYNQADLTARDLDLGSTGVLLIPGTNLLVGGGKEGKIYVLDRANLGHYRAADDGQIVQSFLATNANIHGSPVFWNGPAGALMYVWAEDDALKAYRLVNGRFQTTPAAVGSYTLPHGMPGGILSLSANGAAAGSGILWATTAIGDANQAVRPGILHAYDAANVGVELWNSAQNAGRDDLGNFGKFSSPTIAEGKVYLATFSKQLVVYGLLKPSIVFQPASAAADPGRPPTLRVAATGRGALSYQWYQGRAGDTSAPIAGATQPAFTPARGRVGAASYWVRVSNGAGSADSAAALVDSRYRSFLSLARR